MSRSCNSYDHHPLKSAAMAALAVSITTALTSWPATLRLTVICAALSLPLGTGVTLYLLLR